MVVLRLVPKTSDMGTISVLRALLSKALQGDLAGIALCYRTRGGFEDAVYAGVYKDRPAEAVRAAMRISWRLTQIEEDRRGPP